MSVNHDPSVLATLAGLIVAFATPLILFRIQRELDMHERGEITWIPWADWLLILASVACLVGVLLPLAMGLHSSAVVLNACAAILAASIALVAGYIFSILAHYRLILSFGRSGPRTNPEPSEVVLIVLTVALALGIGTFVVAFAA